MAPEMTLNDSLAADSVLDGLADGVFAVNSDLRIISFNRAAEKILGVEKGQALGGTSFHRSRHSFLRVCASAPPSLISQRGG